jgi:tetratricopeptide (TPR) repeat protein
MIKEIGENMRTFLVLFSFLVTLICLNLRQSLAQQPPVTSPATQPTLPPTFTPSTPPPAGGSASPGNPSTTPTSNVSPTGKYYEYQSFCRAPLELKSPYNEAQFNKKLEEVKATFAAKKTFATLEPIIDLLLGENKIREARAIATENKTLITPNQDAVLQARILYAEKRYRDAIAILSQPDLQADIPMLIEFSKSYRKLENYFEAKTALQDAMKLDNKSGNQFLLDICILDTEDSDHAAVELDCGKIVRQNPKDYLALIYLGISHRERENYKEAQKYFEKSAQIQKSEFAMSCLGELFYLQKNLGKAIEAFKAAAAIEPRSGRAQMGAAKSLYEMLRYDEALPYFINACKLDRAATVKLREALQPLEAAKNKAANAYYQGAQQCMSSK